MARVANSFACWLLILVSVGIRAQAPKIIAYAPGSCCRTVWVDGQSFYIIQDENVSVAVGPPQNFSARQHAVVIEVRQDGDTSIDVDPSKFMAWADDDAKTPLPYLDMGVRAEHDRKHQSVMAGIFGALAAGAAGAAAATPQTATVNNSNGTSSTVTYTDPAVATRTNEISAANAKQNQETINARHEAKVTGLLKHNTLSHGQTVSGLVYFEGPKSMKPTKKGFTPMAHLAVVLNGTTYLF